MARDESFTIENHYLEFPLPAVLLLVFHGMIDTQCNYSTSP